MRKISVSLLSFWVLFSTSLKAQFSFDADHSIPVVIDDTDLKNAWSGGLNFPQFSAIDLDLDGVDDLLVFDRSGNRILPFINEQFPDSVSYRYDASYAENFPKLRSWALMIDYNCDGKKDIFSYNNSGIIVYRNTSTSELTFEKAIAGNNIPTDFGNGSIANLFVSAQDLPAIADIDEDGDLDVLTMSLFGSVVEYHQNQSMEEFGHCDSLKYKLVDNCWGNFAETGFSNAVVLGITCKGGPGTHSNQDPYTLRDAGTTLLALDMDADQDKEIIIGHLTFSTLVMVTNGGDLANADMVAQDDTFPSNSVPVDISEFPGAFFVDVDNDGRRDLIAAPNRSFFASNFESIWFYRNEGSDSVPLFEYVREDLFQDQMIDVGEGAYPVLFDYNGDALPDLVLGNGNYWEQSIGVSKVALFENVGSEGQPAFELITRDLANISSLSLQNVIPTFGDLDGDGDQDMLIGELNGVLHLFENTAGPGVPPNFMLSEPQYKGIDVGAHSAPQLIDINKDGLLDLLIGHQGGKIYYYRNSGSLTNAVFVLETTALGGVDVSTPGSQGYSTPHVFSVSGEMHMFVGCEKGNVHHYDAIDGNLSGSFNLVASASGGIGDGIRSSATVWDWNADNYPDVLVGNYSGGLRAYTGKAFTGISGAAETAKPFKLYIVPNPAQDRVTISTDAFPLGRVAIFGANGSRIDVATNFGSTVLDLPISDLAPGLYLIKAYASSGRYALAKLLVR